MILRRWIVFLTMSVLECYGAYYFFSAFFKKRFNPVVTFLLYYWIVIPIGLIADWVGYWKFSIQAVCIGLVVKFLYETTWRQSIFFSAMYLSVFWLSDIAFLGLFAPGVTNFSPISLPMQIMEYIFKIMTFLFIVLIKRSFAPAWNLKIFNGIEWYRFMVMPFVTICYGVYVYRFVHPHGIDIYNGVVAIVALLLNFVFYRLICDMVLDRQRLERAALKEQKLQNRIEVYNEMEDMLRMQRKHLHDYKNQIRTIGDLIANGDVETARNLTLELSEGLDAAASVISTKNASFDAILNQKYMAAKSKGIGMSLMVGDLSEVRLTSAEIVCVMGNLLDNAINECERIITDGQSASVRVSISNEKELLITVKNPVVSGVPIEDNRVMRVHENGHGIGLSNVEEITEKYDGSFGISCDEKVFVASVVI